MGHSRFPDATSQTLGAANDLYEVTFAVAMREVAQYFAGLRPAGVESEVKRG
jgi:hypothetical protein